MVLQTELSLPPLAVPTVDSLQEISKTEWIGDARSSEKGCAASHSRTSSFLSRLLSKAKRKSFSQVGPLVSPRGSQEFFSKYRLGEVLGTGSFGVVRRCTNLESSSQAACKVLSKTGLQGPQEEEAVRNEVQLMQLLRPHPHILELVEVFEDLSSVYIVMELCEEGELYNRLAVESVMPPKRAATILFQLTKAVAHAHKLGLLHRDIKLENVLIVSLHPIRVKLADWGSAVQVSSSNHCSTPRAPVGSLLYHAPEVLRHRRYSGASDIWALGVVLHALLSGGLPFVADTAARLQRDIRKYLAAPQSLFCSPCWSAVPEGAKELLLQMLAGDALKRPTAEQVLNDRWLAEAAMGVTATLS